MEVRAHLRYLRIAPRKVRLVINLIRGLSVDQATEQLTVLPKRSALPILKLLNSAIANAEHNFKLERKNLMVKSIIANEGPRLKRFQPRAFGRAAEILKRMTHVTIVLEDPKHVDAKPKAKATTPKTVPAESVKSETAPKQPVAKTPKLSTRVKKSPTDQAKARDAKDKEIRRQGTS
ncbi:MAG: 50S ribosomal protein L22 [Candidatus Kerfeldbacteria bacterium]|nr:50S ribosomal protein L22 [Candidatus Kerfeldbacteria bacterium]